MTTTETDRQAETSVRAVEQRVFTAIKTGNVAALREELTEDFVHSPIGSAEQDRSAFLQAIEQMPYRIDELVGEDVRVRVYGDVAILSGVQRARVSLPDGTAVTARTPFVDLFVRGDRWRLRHAVSVELAETREG